MKGGDEMSRIIGMVFPDDGEAMRINQVQHATPNGYEIHDTDKRAEYEKRKAKFKKSKAKNKE